MDSRGSPAADGYRFAHLAILYPSWGSTRPGTAGGSMCPGPSETFGAGVLNAAPGPHFRGKGAPTSVVDSSSACVPRQSYIPNRTGYYLTQNDIQRSIGGYFLGPDPRRIGSSLERTGRVVARSSTLSALTFFHPIYLSCNSSTHCFWCSAPESHSMGTVSGASSYSGVASVLPYGYDCSLGHFTLSWVQCKSVRVCSP